MSEEMFKNNIKSWVELDNQHKQYNEVLKEIRQKKNNVLDKYSVNPPNVYGFGHKVYYEHLIDCIINKKKQLVDGFSGRKSLEVVIAIYESIDSGKEIFLNSNSKKIKLGQKVEK